jgi:ribosomal protein S18 acetylase RimI-like enzyme
MGIEIRRAEAADAHEISRIYALSWKTGYRGMIPQDYLDALSEDYWTPKFQKWLSEGTLRALILSEDSVPAGAIAFGKSREKNLPDWGEVASLYLRPEFFRRGYGKKLMEEAFRFFRENGYQDCFLWVLRENERAQAFYRSLGFRMTPDTVSYEIAGKMIVDLRYILHLS